MKKYICMWYSAFVTGGSVWRPVKTAVNSTELEKVNGERGVNLLTMKTPGGNQIVIEEESGGIVGNDVADVIDDILASTDEEVRQQIDAAVKEAGKAVEIDNDRFFKMLDKGIEESRSRRK